MANNNSQTLYAVEVDTRSSPVIRLNVIACTSTDNVVVDGHVLHAVCSTRASTCPVHAFASTSHDGCDTSASDEFGTFDETA